MTDGHTLFAPVPLGLEAVLADELRALGALRVRPGRAGVAFEGSLETAYRACLWSRVASRVLLRVADVPARDPEELYRGVLELPWEEHVAAEGTLAVDVVASRSPISHTGYATLKVKDAIVDRLRERFGVRPDIDTSAPDVRVNVALRGTKAAVSIDLAGEGLHRRGYRTPGEQAIAPLKENLAASVLLLAGWPEVAAGGGAFCDPLCGSGTLVLEAALIACDIAPGSLSERWGFTGWLGHDAEVWERLLAEAAERREAGLAAAPPMLGTDVDRRAIGLARASAGRAGLSGRVRFEARDVRAAAPPAGAVRGLLATNPPYGERLSAGTDLRALYAAIGNRAREAFAGWRVCIVTGAPDLVAVTGLAPGAEYSTYNGRIPVTVIVAETGGGTDAATADTATPQPDSGAAMLGNRLRKSARHLGKWARRTGVSCYRVYDADLPEYAVAVDVYEGAGPDAGKRVAHVAEYAPPATIEPEVASRRLHEAVATVADVLDIAPADVFLKVRRRQKGSAQYTRQSDVRRTMIVAESGLLFEVNLSEYLDTGLFLDHRETRAMLRDASPGARFLNLYAYTGAATVYAAAGGAASTTTVDLSSTYLDWAERNMLLNGLTGGKHTRVRADVLEWLERSVGRTHPFDLVFCDPPTFSNSKRMEGTFDVQRDHVQLIDRILPLLAEDGVLIFSNNFRKFRMEAGVLEGVGVEDITRQTIPQDFERNPKIHNTWRITKTGGGGGA
ncbi:MAG: bifunctional 23S rRNA (guanine(2069)-N(7))-methyltransferase RlmK/23S rRNA (guanine(2445)-N(2))-methyltransferase RlmL [Anaerosomatales bacterium]|nr:bifunctional 23S rRNA (guanine(2069)-N(7))-methyltransferase RlmK/23S rRNA (guanine(2445)-N(2))-methyltransferase RlmL [Anaerosomatales bacterium]